MLKTAMEVGFLSPKKGMEHQDGMYTAAMLIHAGYFPAVSNWL